MYVWHPDIDTMQYIWSALNRNTNWHIWNVETDLTEYASYLLPGLHFKPYFYRPNPDVVFDQYMNETLSNSPGIASLQHDVIGKADKYLWNISWEETLPEWSYTQRDKTLITEKNPIMISEPSQRPLLCLQFSLPVQCGSKLCKLPYWKYGPIGENNIRLKPVLELVDKYLEHK